jgi:hypothetical protein
LAARSMFVVQRYGGAVNGAYNTDVERDFVA